MITERVKQELEKITKPFKIIYSYNPKCKPCINTKNSLEKFVNYNSNIILNFKKISGKAQINNIPLNNLLSEFQLAQLITRIK